MDACDDCDCKREEEQYLCDCVCHVLAPLKAQRDAAIRRAEEMLDRAMEAQVERDEARRERDEALAALAELQQRYDVCHTKHLAAEESLERDVSEVQCEAMDREAALVQRLAAAHATMRRVAAELTQADLDTPTQAWLRALAAELTQDL